MRSAQSHRRCRPANPVRAQLTALARIIDEATVDDPCHVLVHVVEDTATTRFIHLLRL